MSYFDDVYEPSLYFIHNKKNTHKPRKFNFEKTDTTKIFWITSYDEKLKISDMEDKHLINSYKLLGRRIGTDLEKPTDAIYFGYLRCELNKRKLLEI